MSLSPLAQSLIAAGVALVRDNGPGIIAAFRAHDWNAVARDAAQAELTLAAAAGVPGAKLALKLLPVGLHLIEHPAGRPADPKEPAMAKAAGPGGGATWSHAGDSPDIGAVP